jgi:hypothetical protein
MILFVSNDSQTKIAQHDCGAQIHNAFLSKESSTSIGGETLTPKVRPFMRRKPGQKKRTVHVKGHIRHK